MSSEQAWHWSDAPSSTRPTEGQNLFLFSPAEGQTAFSLEYGLNDRQPSNDSEDHGPEGSDVPIPIAIHNHCHGMRRVLKDVIVFGLGAGNNLVHFAAHGNQSVTETAASQPQTELKLRCCIPVKLVLWF